MKHLIIGFVIGLIIGGGSVWIYKNRAIGLLKQALAAGAEEGQKILDGIRKGGGL